MESIFKCKKCASNHRDPEQIGIVWTLLPVLDVADGGATVCRASTPSKRSKWRRGAYTCRYPYKRYDSSLMFQKARRKRVSVSMVPCSSTSSRKFGRLGTKEARNCWRSGTPKESCPSRPLEWKTYTRREKGACSGVIRFNLGDSRLDLLFGRTANRVEGVRESTEWTWTLTTACYGRGCIIILMRCLYITMQISCKGIPGSATIALIS